MSRELSDAQLWALARQKTEKSKLILPGILIPLLCVIIFVMVLMNILERKEIIRRISMRSEGETQKNGPGRKSESQKMIQNEKPKRKKSLFPLSMGFGIHTQLKRNEPVIEQGIVEEGEI